MYASSEHADENQFSLENLTFCCRELFQAVFSYGFMKQWALQIKTCYCSISNFQLFCCSAACEKKKNTKHICWWNSKMVDTQSADCNGESTDAQLTFYEQRDSISTVTRDEIVDGATDQKLCCKTGELSIIFGGNPPDPNGHCLSKTTNKSRFHVI